ncbi:hypothetical protein F5Y19DRAFT_490813 [Xylariaceae sp. FL1651]|nr:hypothetical protein F5Y19DRAFT_490813 [Xylariaceae sp. FL1651]
MASLQFHSWFIPGHYLHCKRCRDFRRIQVRHAALDANSTARMYAIDAGVAPYEVYRTRQLRITPRIHTIQQEERIKPTTKQVTIQVPSLSTPVRPLHTIGLPVGYPVDLSRKRPFTLVNTTDPSRSFIPHIPQHILPRAAPYSWAKIPALPGNPPATAFAEPPPTPAVTNDDFPMPGAWPSWADEQVSTPGPAAMNMNLNANFHFATQIRDGVYNTFGFFREASANIYAAVGNRFFRPAQQPNTTTTTQVVEDDGAPSAKRPRFDRGPDFNYAGCFSVDMIEESDSEDDEDNEDDEYPGSPMDLDEPEPMASNHVEATPVRKPIEPMNVGSVSKSDSVVTAARRAVKLFPKKEAAVLKVPATPVVQRHEAPVTPAPTTPAVEKYEASTAGQTPMPKPGHSQKPRTIGKPQYQNILEFFENEDKHSLPGQEQAQLPANALKIEQMKRDFMERMRQEELDSQNAALRHLGVRRPNDILIREPPSEWVRRALDAPENGRFDPKAVHADAPPLQPRDFAKLVPETAWLNDDCVHSTLCCIAKYVNDKAAIKSKVDPPKCVTLSSLYWMSFCQDHKKLYPRPFARRWNMTPDNFFKINTILIPVNHGSHWTLIVIRPTRKSMSYIDSYGSRGTQHLRNAFDWLKLFLGNNYIDSEWKTERINAPPQTNAYDCGMFVITNAMCLALGLDPMCYTEESMPAQRLRIAAMLLNGGFHGDFDLSRL